MVWDTIDQTYAYAMFTIVIFAAVLIAALIVCLARLSFGSILTKLEKRALRSK